MSALTATEPPAASKMAVQSDSKLAPSVGALSDGGFDESAWAAPIGDELRQQFFIVFVAPAGVPRWRRDVSHPHTGTRGTVDQRKLQIPLPLA